MKENRVIFINKEREPFVGQTPLTHSIIYLKALILYSSLVCSVTTLKEKQM